MVLTRTAREHAIHWAEGAEGAGAGAGRLAFCLVGVLISESAGISAKR